MHGPIFGYLIDNKNKNNYISVRLPNSIEYLNSTVYIYYGNKKQMRQNIVGGVGFGSDQSHLLTFGLGKINKVDKLIIKTIYGKKYKINNPEINKIIKL